MLNLKSERNRAPRQQLSQFGEWFKGNKNNPSYSNRYSLSFATPPILRTNGGYVNSNFDLEYGENGNYLNYYANTINLPSKQVTTGSITSVGSTYNYATSSTFSQINISFIIPRNHKTRTIFERWISIMSSDSNQYTDYYENYVCPHLYIYKWERGGGPEFPLPEEFRRRLRALGIREEDVLKYKDDQLVGIYDITNVFPYNIGSMTLSNEQAGLMTLDVGFYYERYRFYGDSIFDSRGRSYLSTGEVGITTDIV